uniref:Transmembrane protein n=1 Tax=Steinernema glaseri TaxID=37863 RepID=A0A1I8AAC9_9BILA
MYIRNYSGSFSVVVGSVPVVVGVVGNVVHGRVVRSPSIGVVSIVVAPVLSVSNSHDGGESDKEKDEGLHNEAIGSLTEM